MIKILLWKDVKVNQVFEYRMTVTPRKVNLFLSAAGKNFRKHLRQVFESLEQKFVPPHMIPMLLAEVSLGDKKHANLSLVSSSLRCRQPITVGQKLIVSETIISKGRKEQIDSSGQKSRSVKSRKIITDKDGNILAEYTAIFYMALE